MLAERALKKYNLRMVSDELSKPKFLKKYAASVFECIDECYKDLYGTVPFTPEMIAQMVDQFMLLLDMRYMMAVADENDRVVAFGFCLPGIGKALQKSGGKMTLGCIFRLMKALKNPTSIDLGIVGVLPEFRKSGLTAFIMIKLQKMLESGSIEYLETNLNLEHNVNIQAQWKHFKSIQHKRRRSYIKKL